MDKKYILSRLEDLLFDSTFYENTQEAYDLLYVGVCHLIVEIKKEIDNES